MASNSELLQDLSRAQREASKPAPAPVAPAAKKAPVGENKTPPEK